MTTAVEEQLAKISPTSAGAQVLQRARSEVAQEQAAAAQQQGAPRQTLFDQTQQVAAQLEAERAAASAETADLEAKHGKLATVGTQFGRGVLDALLAPGALAGVAWEATGDVFGLEGVKQQGRDLGRASSGEAAIEAASYLFGGGGKAGLTTAERVLRDVDEQQKAWPTLSAVSHTAGVIAPALVGGVAATGSKAAAMVGLGAFEGASGGAQVAYEQNAALRDVLSSALVGGALGGAAGGLGEGLSGLVRSKPLRAAARELQEDANLSAVGIGRKDLTRQFGSEAGAVEQKATELAGEISGYRFQSGPLEGKPLVRMLRTPENIQEGVGLAQKETAGALAAARQEIAAKAAASPETAGLAEILSAPPAGTVAKELDDVAEQALTALGGNVDEFKALRGRAQAFEELTSLVDKAKAAPGTQSQLGTALGTVAAVADLVGGSGGLASLAKGVLTTVGHKVAQQRSASTIASLSNMLVLDKVSTALQHVIPAVETAAASAAGRAPSSSSRTAEPERPERPAPMTPDEQQDRYREQLDTVNKAVAAADPEERAELFERIADLPAPLVLAASADMGERMAQLQADLPKPVPNIRGKAHETLSADQLRLANAMYEATVDPMSVFSDFAAGDVDYDKVKYAWKQYPGLKQAAQAGLMDILTVRLSEGDRSSVPDNILSQMDNLFGFDGGLQPTLDRGFSSRMDQVFAAASEPQQNAPPSGGGKLNSPLAQPSFTQRIAGQR